MMRQGLLWYDDDPRLDLAGKVRRAADYYRRKLGADPDIVSVNPAMPGADLLTTIDGISIEFSRSVLPNHLWIGQREVESQAAAG